MKQSASTWLLVTGAVLLVAVIVRAATLIGTARSEPHLAVKDATVHLGPVAPGHPVRHRFVLTNVGSAELLITEVKSTCGCTVARIASRALDPGRAMSIDVTLTPSKAGRREGRIIVVTNDPKDPAVVLTLKATVVNSATGPATREAHS